MGPAIIRLIGAAGIATGLLIMLGGLTMRVGPTQFVGGGGFGRPSQSYIPIAGIQQRLPAMFIGCISVYAGWTLVSRPRR